MYPCPPSETLGTPSAGVNIFKNSAGSGIEPESRHQWVKWKCRQNATSRLKNECTCCVKIKCKWSPCSRGKGLSTWKFGHVSIRNGGNMPLIERVRTALKRTTQFFRRVLPLHHPACYTTNAWEREKRKRLRQMNWREGLFVSVGPGPVPGPRALASVPHGTRLAL